jgi:hypothetical protein
MAHYMVYWKPSTVAESEHLPGIQYSASNQYDKLAVGDVIWVVTSEGADDLVLVGRQRVDHLMGRVEAERCLGMTDLWDATHYAISDMPEEKAILDISRWASRLTFDGRVESLPPGFSGQHLQTMRRLAVDSVTLLEWLWSRSSDVAAPGD